MNVGRFFISCLLAIILCVLAISLVGENPLVVFRVLAMSAFGSAENLSYTLFFATPLILTGTSVALALEAGLFNIGTEGQLYIGAVCAATWGYISKDWFTNSSSHVWPSVVIFLGAMVSFLGGFSWGAIAGILKTKFRVHEVISTIMLNFIAMALSNWAILYPLKNLETQNTETVSIAEALRVNRLWLHLTADFPFVLVLCVFILVGLRKTWGGFRVRAVGANLAAANLAGIGGSRTMLLSLAFAGGISGLVGCHEVFFNAYKLTDAFSPSFGFMGLAIALISKGNPLSLFAAAILFGALHKGALDLDIETEKVSRDLSEVIQALILVVLTIQPWLQKKLTRKRAY